MAADQEQRAAVRNLVWGMGGKARRGGGQGRLGLIQRSCEPGAAHPDAADRGSADRCHGPLQVLRRLRIAYDRRLGPPGSLPDAIG